MNISTSVTRAAINSTNTGMRTWGLIMPRNIETTPFEATITAVVASPIPSPLVAVPVTASSGHNASSCAKTTLLVHRPSLIIAR